MATNREQIAARGTSNQATTLVIPKVPSAKLPPRILKAYPELEEWQREQERQHEHWREQVNVILVGKIGG